jgi:hypothetical protein
MASDVHWVEIDLLRAGIPSVSNVSTVRSDYRVLVSRAGQRANARCWPISVRQKLPVIGVPLRQPDPDAPLDLGAVLSATYDDAAYDLSIDYGRKPVPPLKSADAIWAERLLRDRKVR